MEMKPVEEDKDDDYLASVEWKSTVQLMGMRGVGKKNNTMEFCINHKQWNDRGFSLECHTLQHSSTASSLDGAAIEFIYVVLFICFANDKTVRNKLGAILCGAVAVFVIVVLVSVFGFHGNSRMLFCGYAAIIGSICMYASPLAVIRVVIQTKKVDYMPFSVSLCGLLCSICWLVYGILGHDVFVIVPNGIGCAVGAFQLIIYVIYYYKNAKPGGEGAVLENAASDQ